jgi:hypothetical protein
MLCEFFILLIAGCNEIGCNFKQFQYVDCLLNILFDPCSLFYIPYSLFSVLCSFVLLFYCTTLIN